MNILPTVAIEHFLYGTIRTPSQAILFKLKDIATFGAMARVKLV